MPPPPPPCSAVFRCRRPQQNPKGYAPTRYRISYPTIVDSEMPPVHSNFNDVRTVAVES